MIGSEVVSTFATSRRIGFLGQIAEHARDAVAHVVRGGFDVAVEAELDGDARALVLAARSAACRRLRGPAIWFSMTCVILVSMTAAEAPRYTVSMLTIGG